MSGGRRRSLALFLAICCASIAGPSARGDEPAPLTNQDIVRMIASGMSEERVLARVRESPGKYDLSADMIDELKLAGVPDSILAAMKERESAAPGGARATGKEDQARGSASSGAPPPARGFIEIAFDDDPSLPAEGNSIAAPAVVPDPNSRTPKNVEMAFVVTCSHPVHVPDHWDTLSPLGESAGRHQILFFQPATAPIASPKKGKEPFVYLPHPPAWRFEAEAAEHRGIIGVAVRLGSEGPFALIAAAPYEALKVESGRLTRVEVRLRAETSRRKGGRDAMHPMISDPSQTIIGSTAPLGGDLMNRISVKVDPPVPIPEAP